MSETITNPNEPAPETSKPARRPRALQSRRASERLETYAEWLQELQNDETVRAQLASFGYAETKIAQGAALYATAQAAYLARQQALTAFAAARDAANVANESALTAFRNFRLVALTALDDPAAETALAAGQRIPPDRQQFVTVARAVYNTVLGEPAFADAMAAHGYPVTVIQNALALLDTLSAALVVRDAAHAAAVQALDERDAALTAMGDWFRRVNRIRTVAARAETDAAHRIG